MKSARIHIVIAALLLIALIAAYVGAYLLISGKTTEVRSLAEELAVKERAGAKNAAARDEAATLAESEAYVAGALLATGDAVAFLERLERTGKAYGATVSVASVDDSAKGSGMISVALSISGSFDAVMHTLSAIEHEKPATAVKSVTFSSGDGGWIVSGIFTVATKITP